MIYVLGDSLSFGSNFLENPSLNRKELIYSTHLSNKLKVECKNFSLHGGSNNRISRLINFLDFQPQDIVIIGWTGIDRLEVSVPKDRLSPIDVIVDYKEIHDIDKKIVDSRKIAQIVEKTENLYTRAAWPSIIYDPGYIFNKTFKEFVTNFYKYSVDPNYQEHLYKMLFYSSLYKLRSSGCKFVMFTAFDNRIKDKSFLNIPEFLFYDSNMIDELRYKDKKYKHYSRKDRTYWSAEEHKKVADMLYDYIIR